MISSETEGGSEPSDDCKFGQMAKLLNPLRFLSFLRKGLSALFSRKFVSPGAAFLFAYCTPYSTV